MEIPLILRADSKGRLVYTIPAWYRILLVFILGIVVMSMVVAGGGPGAGFWIIVAVLALGILYEETWIADAASGTMSHRSGLMILAKPMTFSMSEIEDFAMDVLARGTIPGGEEEKKAKAAAFASLNGAADDASELKPGAKPFRKKSYINLLVRTKDGTVYLVNTTQSRRALPLRDAGKKLAEYCGKPFVEA